MTDTTTPLAEPKSKSTVTMPSWLVITVVTVVTVLVIVALVRIGSNVSTTATASNSVPTSSAAPVLTHVSDPNDPAMTSLYSTQMKLEIARLDEKVEEMVESRRVLAEETAALEKSVAHKSRINEETIATVTGCKNRFFSYTDGTTYSRSRMWGVIQDNAILIEGLRVELDDKRFQLRTMDEDIAHLEAERNELRLQLNAGIAPAPSAPAPTPAPPAPAPAPTPAPPKKWEGIVGILGDGLKLVKTVVLGS